MSVADVMSHEASGGAENARIGVLERRCTRERSARKQAEQLLEAKSRELFDTNSALRQLNQNLETIIERRTVELEKALTSARKANRKSEHQALHDTLTQLPNRRFLRRKLDELTAQCQEEQRTLAVLHVDLDRFKNINDSMGHAAGDHLLRHVSRTLRDIARNIAFVARIGGDEFLVAGAFSDQSLTQVENMAKSIVTQFSRPLEYQGNKLRFGASVGICCQSWDEIDAGQLMINADIALYRAKDLGRGRYEYFTQMLEQTVRQRKQIADELFEALEKGEFVPHYQPRFDSVTHEIDCVEALARWEHPTRGLLTPEFFLDIASDLDLTYRIDDCVLVKTLEDFSKWQADGLAVPKCSVNISQGRLMETGLIERLRSLKLPRGKIAFELLESIFLDEADEETIERVRALKACGIEIEIDDFGSGHASIVGVIQIQPSTIKIDRRIVDGIVTSERMEYLVKAIVDIGRTMDAGVVAEGIESVEQAELCAKLGCASLQGYALARPMRETELRTFAVKHAQRDKTDGCW